MVLLNPLSFIGGAPGGFELLLIFVVILLLFGAKRLPEIARTMGKTMEEFRRAARDVRDEIMMEDTKGDAPPKQITPAQPDESEAKEEAKDEPPAAG